MILEETLWGKISLELRKTEKWKLKKNENRMKEWENRGKQEKWRKIIVVLEDKEKTENRSEKEKEKEK